MNVWYLLPSEGQKGDIFMTILTHVSLVEGSDSENAILGIPGKEAK